MVIPDDYLWQPDDETVQAALQHLREVDPALWERAKKREEEKLPQEEFTWQEIIHRVKEYDPSLSFAKAGRVMGKILDLARKEVGSVYGGSPKQ